MILIYIHIFSIVLFVMKLYKTVWLYSGMILISCSVYSYVLKVVEINNNLACLRRKKQWVRYTKIKINVVIWMAIWSFIEAIEQAIALECAFTCWDYDIWGVSTHSIPLVKPTTLVSKTENCLGIVCCLMLQIFFYYFQLAIVIFFPLWASTYQPIKTVWSRTIPACAGPTHSPMCWLTASITCIACSPSAFCYFGCYRSPICRWFPCSLSFVSAF
jgi:hypothetical protein